MDFQLIPIQEFQIFLVCLSRVAGFVGAIPILLATQTPAQLKAALVFMIALVLFPVMEPSIPPLSFQPGTFLLLMVSEVLLGSMIGLVALMIFTAVEYGGTVIGYQMGFAAANIFDPSAERQLALISQFQNVFAILIFLAIDGHHVFLQVAAESYRILPPGVFNISGEAIPYLITLSSRIFLLGIQFSAPVLTVLLLSGLILGILARVFPQLNVFLLSFPLNIGISFTVIGLTLPLVTILLRREFDNLGERFFTVLQLLN
ncbi:flagellar biosynthetic protein FliR [Desulfocapsa sulfexigens DSM 10523]|uniref:Flagellar biosynthetic protein FliR n=1 Tax=Desulfocapsa sulfexigens (strain DSM 10523 / SB164P1) TaxID=1167006 RepID=M1NJ91_DESSD|nr:flagellar biosynthetic protein FliR [Desulfocapsa sulfexigens]AGF79619.1 flagellar biosynthetic protein FliR [Desulfocapsa sulfexigens DSM 10523]